MPDYQAGRIYAIRAPGTNEVYIGSTVLPLSRRMSQHRAHFKRWKVAKDPFVTSFKILEHEEAYIELIEMFPCNSKEELNRREGEIIRATENCVNRCIAGQTQKEYNATHKEQKAAKMAIYNAAYSATHKNKISAYCSAYRIANKDAIATKQIAYYAANRDQILARRRALYAAKKASTISESPAE